MGDLIQFPIPLRVAPEAGAAVAARFPASRQVAELCDQILPDLGFVAGVAQGRSVAELIVALPPQLQENLQERFGAAALTQLTSLEKEGDAELFFTGLLNLAGRLAEQEPRVVTAIGLYHRIETASGIDRFIDTAKLRRTTLEGGGDFGAKAESFWRNVGRQAGDYRSLVAMFAGAMIGSGLYNIARFRTGRMLSRGLQVRYKCADFAPIEIVAMRFKARGAGLIAGSVGASLAERGLRHAVGQPVSWDAASLARDTAMASINLFAWRNAVAFSDLYSMRAMAQATPRNVVFKEFEIFAFRQALAGTGLSLAMLGNQKLFGSGPDNGVAATAQLSSLVLGMNVGRMAGRRAMVFGH